MDKPISRKPSQPLEVEEVMRFLQKRWGVTYELKLLIKGKSLFLQMMWGFLEQQSFPLSEEKYKEELAKIIDVINRLDQASEVRVWLLRQESKPRLGRALSLPLRGAEGLEEFLLLIDQLMQQVKYQEEIKKILNQQVATL